MRRSIDSHNIMGRLNSESVLRCRFESRICHGAVYIRIGYGLPRNIYFRNRNIEQAKTAQIISIFPRYNTVHLHLLHGVCIGKLEIYLELHYCKV